MICPHCGGDVGRGAGDVQFMITLSAEEVDFVQHMRSLTGVTTQSDILRLGLWHLAKHLDVPIGSAIFAVRGDGRARRSRKVPA